MAPKTPHPIRAPESIGAVCMFCMLRQKRCSFNCNLNLWRGLNGAARCYGNNNSKGREEDTKVVIAAPESSANKSNQTSAGILHTIRWAFMYLWVCVPGRAKAFGKLGEYRYTGTNQPAPEERLASRPIFLTESRFFFSEMWTLWHAPLKNSYQRDEWRSGLWGQLIPLAV